MQKPLWNSKNLKVTVDFTTKCNARCPQCHRNDDKTLKKSEWLPKINWTLDDFKKAFPPEDVQKITEFAFVPTWGDAMLNPHIMDIIKYVFSSNKGINVSIDTNGSMHDENWWFYLGSVSKKLHIIFDVDGINQEMHSTYRRGTKLDKVLSNMKAFSEGIGSTSAQSIIFKHNQEYIKEIKELCFKNGAQRHKAVKSDRFDKREGSLSREYYDSYTKEHITLEIADSYFENGVTIEEAHVPELLNRTEDDVDITCGWGVRDTITVGFDGTVYPCCYIYNPIVMNRNSLKLFDHDVIKYFVENNDELNIFNKSIFEIVEHDFYRKVLTDSLKDKTTAVRQCINHCTKNNKHPKRLQLIATA